MSKADDVIGELDPNQDQCWMCKRYVHKDKLTEDMVTDYTEEDVKLCNLCSMVIDNHQNNVCGTSQCKDDADCYKCLKVALKDKDFFEEAKVWIVEFQKALYG